MIGIIGYGMVGKAVAHGFSKTSILISDPKYNDLTIEYMCSKNPDAIFVCVPTPTDDTNYQILTDVLDKIFATGYAGLVVVKSTILPQYLEKYNVLYNPEFLSRATSNEDFVNPPMVIIGGNPDHAEQLLELYRRDSDVQLTKTFITDVKTASLVKYMMNSFYALKITYMNEMYDVASKLGVSWDYIETILSNHPWMGSHHFSVPGPDGKRGFGGPCLPKDTSALVKEFNIVLLDQALKLNEKFRSN